MKVNFANSINPIKPVKPIKKFDFKSINVSFSRSIIPKFDNEHSLKAYKMGLDLYNNPDTPAEVIIKKHAPEIAFLDIEKQRDKFYDAEAVILQNYKENFEPTNIRLISAQKPKNKSKIRKLIYAMSIAHEYTHYLQMISKKDYDFIKNITENDFEYLCSFMPFCDTVFDDFDSLKIPLTDKIFNPFDIITEKIFKSSVPRKRSFGKSDILASYDFKNIEEFNRFINKKFDEYFEDALNDFLTAKYANPTTKSYLEKIISKKGGLKELKAKTKAFCSYKARKEYEAHQTESALAKKILNTNNQLNIDSYTLCYLMLSNALK